MLKLSSTLVNGQRIKCVAETTYNNKLSKTYGITSGNILFVKKKRFILGIYYFNQKLSENLQLKIYYHDVANINTKKHILISSIL